MPSPLAGIARFPRARLGHAPTPIDAAPNLGAALGIDLYVKREDCTGLAFGGNKVRQLEFHFGEARARGADTVLATGAVQSNLVRIAAAAARRLGMEIHIQIEDRVAGADDLYRASGNLLLDRVLGATLHPFPEGEDEAAADAAMEVRAEALAAEGRKPYVVHSAPGHAPLGGLGYVLAAEEVSEQARALDIRFDAVVCASGSALTHAGLLTGLRALGERAPVLGICVRRDAAGQAARVARVGEETREGSPLSMARARRSGAPSSPLVPARDGDRAAGGEGARLLSGSRRMTFTAGPAAQARCWRCRTGRAAWNRSGTCWSRRAPVRCGRSRRRISRRCGSWRTCRTRRSENRPSCATP